MTAGHWHYAVSAPAPGNPAQVETMTGPESTLSRDEAKRMLQPLIRRAQGRVRYADPADPSAKKWEPADWWMQSDELVWIHFPEGPPVLFAVYPCHGDCAAAAIAHRDEVAARTAAHGLNAAVEPPNRLN
jgi:hypothetical protein